MIRNQLDFLINWLKESKRKPLILRGARQVGKSTVVNDFAKYANQQELLHLLKILDFIPLTLGQKIKYVKIDPDAKSAALVRLNLYINLCFKKN